MLPLQEEGWGGDIEVQSVEAKESLREEEEPENGA
jgi:hypothetical protein